MQVGRDPRPVMREAYDMFKDGGDPEKVLISLLNDFLTLTELCTPNKCMWLTICIYRTTIKSSLQIKFYVKFPNQNGRIDIFLTEPAILNSIREYVLTKFKLL